MADSDFKIAVASADQVEWIMKMADNEGWNPGCNDAVTYHQVDPTGFFVGLLNNQPVCCVSSVKYENYAFGGHYIVAKEHRGKGYGLKIFDYAMDYLKDCNRIGLDSVVNQQSNYEKSGYNLFHKNMRYVGVIPKLQVTCDNIFEAKSVSFAELLEYDKRHNPGCRKYFISSWLNLGTNSSVVYLDTDKNIQGFAAIRKCFDGYKIGPLFAEKFEYAEALIHTLVDTIGGCKVYIDIPVPNENAKKLVDKLNMKAVFETIRMYTGEKITGIDLNTIYGLTCLELG